MNHITGRKTLRSGLVAALLAAIAAPAAAQLEIGGRAFESNDAAPAAAPATAGDDLTRRIQRDLVALGYEPGSINGEMSVDTAVAISRFQAENGLEVSGEVSPQLAGILAARVGAMRDGGQAAAAPATAAGQAAAPPSASAQSGADCVPKAAEEASDASRNASRLARAGGRLFSRFGGDEARAQVADATATAADVAEVADVVSDLTACEPGG